MLIRGKPESLGEGHWRGVALLLLAVLAIGQSVVVGHRILRRDPPDLAVAVGHDLSKASFRDSGGETIAMDAGHETLLLVFDPDCPHTERVAGAWASWLADEESTFHRTIAVSPGPLGAAVRYARDSHWSVRVGSVEPSEDRVVEHSLTSRTPWVFAIGADGRVEAEGHGVRLTEIAQAIRERRGGEQDRSGSISRR